jgi:flagellar motor switch protein FliG
MNSDSASAANGPSSQSHRVFGYQGRLIGQPEIEPWHPADEATIDNRLPLAEPVSHDGPPQSAPAESAPDPQPAPPLAAEPAPEKALEPATTPPPVKGPTIVPRTASPRRETAHDKVLSRTQQMVRERPEDAAKLVRTMLFTASDQGDAQPALQTLAVLMVSLGQETAGEVLKFLSDYEIEEITQATVSLKNVTVATQDQVMTEFIGQMEAGEWVSQGGMDFARGALERAVGPRKAQQILDRVASTVSSGFYILKDLAAEQVAPFISHEHPQAIALILSQLDSTQSGGILDQLPARMQADVAHRIATMGRVTPAVVREIEKALAASLGDIVGDSPELGGAKVVADMLNMSGSSTEKNVLEQMHTESPEAAETVRNLMFTFSDIIKLNDIEIQSLINVVDQDKLVIALKAAEDALKDKILGNVSAQTRQTMTERMEFLGPMRLGEVEQVQISIVQQVRKLEEEGQLTMVRGDSEDSYV